MDPTPSRKRKTVVEEHDVGEEGEEDEEDEDEDNVDEENEEESKKFRPSWTSQNAYASITRQ